MNTHLKLINYLKKKFYLKISENFLFTLFKEKKLLK